MLREAAVAVLLTIALVSAGCGSSGGSGGSGSGSQAGPAARTIDVEMSETAFTPDSVTVAKGVDVEFRFSNRGKVGHEAFVGSPSEQREHERSMTDGHDGHDMGAMDDDGSAVTVEPGRTGRLTTRFAEAGTYEIGCHEPGHYAAGMKLTVEVS